MAMVWCGAPGNPASGNQLECWRCLGCDFESGGTGRRVLRRPGVLSRPPGWAKHIALVSAASVCAWVVAQLAERESRRASHRCCLSGGQTREGQCDVRQRHSSLAHPAKRRQAQYGRRQQCPLLLQFALPCPALAMCSNYRLSCWCGCATFRVQTQGPSGCVFCAGNGTLARYMKLPF